MLSLNYRLLAVIYLGMLAPSLYATTRIYFLSALPDTSTLSIAAQSAWLHLGYEVLHEALILPLYFLLGQVVADRPALYRRLGHAVRIALIGYGVLTAVILLGAGPLTAAMAQQPELQAATAAYLRLEALGAMLSLLNDICLVVFVTLGRSRLILMLLLLRLVGMIGFDALLVGQFSWSWSLGVTGVALGNIGVALLLLVPSALALARFGLLGAPAAPPVPHSHQDRQWIREWWRIATKSGLETLVRNLAFAWMILRLVNEIDEAGQFWLTSGFIWGWLLPPILALGTVLRRDASQHNGRLGRRFGGYLAVAFSITVLWGLSIPGWDWFIGQIMGVQQPQEVTALALALLGFYVVFAFNHLIDSYFYGIGRTDMMLYQSLFVSVVYYGAAFLAYHAGVFRPDLQQITLLFGGGLVLDTLLTLWQFLRFGHLQTARQPAPPQPALCASIAA